MTALSMASLVRGALGLSGMPLTITGRKQALLVRVADALGISPPTHLDTPYGRLSLDARHRPERLLGLAFDNILRDYLASELYQYMASLERAPGDVFVDIGANLGFYSLLARKAGYDTVVFEPEPHHVDFLQRNRALYGAIFPIALSDSQGTASFHVADSHNSGASSLVDHPGIYAEHVTVPVDTFTACAARPEFPTGTVRLIKIDVEGAEVGTVRGMAGWLEASGARPHIWCEVRGGASTRGPNTWRDVTATLAGFGYRSHLWRDGHPVPVDPAETFAERGIFDLVFIPS
jgi:FkbM family methyltransferase